MPSRIIAMLGLAAALLAAAPAEAERALGGARGVVKSAKGEPLEGMMVQLIAERTAIRTTVFSNDAGRYEFPKLEPGRYVLRIARPREFHPFVREGVEIGAATELPEIVLERVTDRALLPPFEEIAAQLTGSEWLQSLSGTGEEKKLLTLNCNWCHSYQQIFRNRYDEDGWRKIVNRMTHGAGSPLIIMRQGRLPAPEEAKLVRWLATVRGPEAKDPPFVAAPRPKGPATRVVITEYELPRLELATHDVAGDSKGNIWYSPHRSSFIGRLDPRTGEVKEYHVPLAPDALPGTHWIWVDRNDIVWGSENWAQKLYRFDPRTEAFSIYDEKVKGPVNASMGGNYAVDPQGYIWKARDNFVTRVDLETGATRTYALRRTPSTYGSAVSKDGRYFGGGAWPRDGLVVVDSKTDEVYEPETSPGSGPARGEFDPNGNYWAGGRDGALIEFDVTQKRVREYPMPTPYAAFYTANVDRNGEVWAGELHGGHYARFNPKTERWTEYMLPEPYGHDRESWIDNSTDPVTVWYVDHDGWIVRIEPLE